MMTETVHEAPVLATVADALLVNLGTLSTDAMAGISATVEAAIAAGHPWVLIPRRLVRLRFVRRWRNLLASGPTVVRGNASEILALVHAGGRTGC